MSSDSLTSHSSCCPPKEPVVTSCCPSSADASQSWWKRFDKILWPSFFLVSAFYLASFFEIEVSWLHEAAHHTRELVHKMWWGVALGIVFVGLIEGLPRKELNHYLSGSHGLVGIFRATLAGIFFDLCSHGILMVGMKLYKEGASLGQTMAFLIASPWNSLSLTIVLVALIGLPWTLAVVLLSALVAFASGLMFEKAVASGFLPENPSRNAHTDSVSIKSVLVGFRFPGVSAVVKKGMAESRMILRWLLFGIIIAVGVQMLLSEQQFQAYFGASLLGLMATVGLSTVLEVCSEGSAPLASQFLTKAGAPGNTFAFLMTGVSTDYTEIMAIRDTMASWKIALALPLFTLPQVVLIAWLLNNL
ncbi:MAG: permease [Bdellovibrionales bacterium]|nr:permease [Bdellovibrionales bacterium]